MPIQTSNDLIVKAFYLINEYSPYEQPSSAEIAEGLDYLNDILASLNIGGINIPYVHTINFNMVPSQDTYSFGQDETNDVISNKILDLFDVYIVYQDIQYPLEVIDHDTAFQLARALSTTTRPTKVFLQNAETNSTLKFIYSPDMAYTCYIRAKFYLGSIGLAQNITSVPNTYFRYLRYKLAKELASVFETNTWDDFKDSELNKMEADIKALSNKNWAIKQTRLMQKNVMGFGKIYISAP
jgi:hypothetical protein